LFCSGVVFVILISIRVVQTVSKPTFAIGFLTGQEIDWLPEVMAFFKTSCPKSMSLSQASLLLAISETL